MKNLPYNPNDVIDDPIYNNLLAHRDIAIPCLIERITDTTLMEDPRPAPKVSDFRIADAAMFALLMITTEKWQPETMFTPKYAELWKTEGVYAYFAFVEKVENRKKLQVWWRNWMKSPYERISINRT